MSPMPTPKKDETEDNFISRCMGDEVMKEDYPGQDQRLAICYSQWEEKKSAARSAVDWAKEYGDSLPDWAKSLAPSLFAQRFLEEVRSHGLVAGQILEIGCGNGRDSIFISKGGDYRVTGIDIVPDAVAMATQNAEDLDAQNVSFRVADAEQLPFDDRSIAAVFSLSVLHDTDMQKSLSEVARVLDAQGLLFFYIYLDTETPDTHKDVYVSLDDLIGSVRDHFVIEDIYAEQEEDFDESQERHRIAVTLCVKR